MGTYRELTVIDAPSQAFTTTLSGKRCDFVLNFNAWVNRWSFDLAIDGVPVFSGRRIVTGIDLIAAFGFGIGSLIAVPWGSDPAQPGRTELPSGRVRLLHYDPDDDNA